MKRGQAEFLEWFPRLFMLLVAVIVVALLVRFFAYRDVDATDVHVTSYLYRIHYDDRLITYKHPETERVYSGVIDTSKFFSEHMDQTYGSTGKISSRLTLTGSCIEPKEIWHDKQTYEQYIGFARFGTLGPGGATVHEDISPVTIHTEQERCQGILNITVVRPNS